MTLHRAYIVSLTLDQASTVVDVAVADVEAVVAGEEVLAMATVKTRLV